MGFWKDRTKDWVFGYLPAEQTPDKSPINDVEADSAYITVWLKSARIVNVRSGLSKFFGTVHCHTSLPIRGQTEVAHFHHVTTPSKLRDADAKNIDRIVDVNHEVLGPIPYVGGTLDIEAGLFSLKSADLVQPYLEVLENLSSLAGVSYVQAAKPFVAPIQKGMDLLLHGGGDQILETGISRGFNPVKTGYFVTLRATKDQIKLADLKVVGDDFRLESSGKSIQDFPYMVFEIKASPKRHDGLMIPEIKDAHEKLRQTERGTLTGGKVNFNDVEDAFSVFRRITLTSHDLLFPHAEELVSKIEIEKDKILAPKKQAKSVKRLHLQKLEDVPVSFV